MKCAFVTAYLKAHNFSPPIKYQGCHKLTGLCDDVLVTVTYSKPLEHLVRVYFGIDILLLSLELVVLYHFSFQTHAA